jgi:capsular exopolysaccharide synthesis family protein
MTKNSANLNGSLLAPASGENTTVELWDVIWKRKWLILLTTAIALALGGLYYVQEDPTYESMARILVTQEQSALPAVGFVGVDMFLSQQRQANVITQSLIIRSPLVVARAVEGVAKTSDDKLLRELADVIGGMPEQGSDSPGGSSTRTPNLRTLPSMAGKEPISTIIKNLEVDLVGTSSDVVDLRFRSPAVEDSRVILDAIIRSYVVYLKGTRDDLMKETTDLIDNARNDLARDLEESEKNYRNFRGEYAHLLFRGRENVNMHFVRLAEIENARSKLLLRRSQLQGQLKSMKSAVEGGTSHEVLLLLFEQDFNVRSPLTGRQESLTRQLLPMMLEELLLTGEYGEDHPDVIAVRKRLDLTRETLSEDQNNSSLEAKAKAEALASPSNLLEMQMSALEQQLAALSAEELELATLFDQEQLQAKKLEQLEVQEEALHEKVRRKRLLFDAVVKRLEEINLTDDLGGYDVAIISPPSLAVQVAPNILFVIVLAGSLGFAAGFSLGYVAELSDRRFRNADEIQRYLGLPLIGHVPVINSVSKRKRVSRELDGMLIAAHRSSSQVSESFRTVRTALYFSTRGTGHQVIQITSPTPGDGKSTNAANLAITIAQSNKSVLLVDGDFRRSMVHKMFDIERQPGLSSVIEGELEPSEAVQKSSIDNLHLMTAGPSTQNPSELLSSQRFEEVLDVLRDRFDFVIIDSPPMLAVTDATAIASRVDGTLLVLRLNKQTRTTAKRASELLRSVEANITGIIVNGVGSKIGYGSGAGGYQGYGYGGSYGYNGYKMYGAYRSGSASVPRQTEREVAPRQS